MVSHMTEDPTSLKREIHPMPQFVKDSLMENDLMESYRERPPYQQNDYIGWITIAKREGTRRKRLDQMLEELRQGDVYMKMEWRPRTRG